MIFTQKFTDVLSHDGLIEEPMLLHVPLDEESARLPQQNMNHCHVEEIFSCSDVWAFDTVAKEHV